VFLSHFAIDRWSLADRWLRWIGGRAPTVYPEDGDKNIPEWVKPALLANYTRLRGGFTALVYTIVDNTMHVLLMLGAAWALAKVGLL
jgi:hypothetical protein